MKEPMAWPVPKVRCLDLEDTRTRLLQVPASVYAVQESNTLSAASLFLLPLGALGAFSLPVLWMDGALGKCIFL